MRYFDLANPLHHEDEERHVFAVLRSPSDPATADAQLAAMGQDMADRHGAPWPTA
jgi:hypothetical protein